MVHALLHTEVEHGFLFAIINTCHTRLVTLLIVCPHTFYNRGGQILHGCLGVTCHKLLTVNQYLFHLLAVDGDLTRVINLCTREATHEFFHYRSFWSAVC